MLMLYQVRSASSQRLDWLIGKLIVQVHSYYWFVMFVKENGFVYNFVTDQISKTSWKNVLNIPDIDIFYDPTNPDIVKIKWQFGQLELYYIVSKSSSKMAVCDCPDAKRGNLCKHVAKAYMYIKGSVDGGENPSQQSGSFPVWKVSIRLTNVCYGRPGGIMASLPS